MFTFFLGVRLCVLHVCKQREACIEERVWGNGLENVTVVVGSNHR